jgi:hypothetical protein
MLLFSTSLYSFELIENQKILLFNWTDKTLEMNYEDFQSACSNYAGFAIEYQIQRLLVDTRNFAYKLPPEYVAWREQKLNPRYYQLGVKKFAYLVPKEVIEFTVNIPAENGKFATQYFADESKAIAWLLAD